MDRYLLGGSVVVVAVFAMTMATYIRRRLFMSQGADSSAEVDGYTGLVIFIIAVIAMTCITESKTSIPNPEPPGFDFLTPLRELIKLTLGAIGALYIKSCYDKHDKAWKEKHAPAMTDSSICNTRKTTFFYQDEICGEGHKATANDTPPNTP